MLGAMAMGDGSSAPNRSAEEAMVRAMHEHIKAAEPIDPIAETIHPDAEMRLLVSFGKPLHGRAAVVEALDRGRQAAPSLPSSCETVLMS
jgi:hypothetical protein